MVRSIRPCVTALCFGFFTLVFSAPSRLPAQVVAVVDSPADDELAYPWDDPDTEIDESTDGVCEDADHRCTLRAALDEAWYMDTYAVVTFSFAGSIVQDSTLGTFYPPPGSVIDGNSRAVAIRGSGSYPFLMSIDSQTTIRGLQFRGAWNGLDVIGNHNIIGGNFVSEGNLFLGMQQDAIFLLGDSNLVEGNQIGVGYNGDQIGTAPNGDPVYNRFGIFVMGSHNIIGDSIGTYRNVISRNAIGISMVGDDEFVPCAGNVVRGNMIGTNDDGTVAQSNGYGIEMLYGSGHLIGGAPGDGFNIISGNREAGILAGIGTDGVTIADNLIGVNINQSPLGNKNGMILGPGSSDCLVFNNLIQRNSAYGIEIAGGHAGFNYPSTRHLIAGNKVNDNGLGIVIGAKATENVIGSSLSVDREPNEIQSNSQGGVLISSPVGTPNEARLNTVRKNLFLDNYEDGIVVVQSQDFIVPPSLLGYDTAAGQGVVTGRHDRVGSIVDVYEGKKFNDTWYEGYTWLGSATVQVDSSFVVVFPDCGCGVVAATVTDPAGNTSAFSILQRGVAVIQVSVAMNSGWNMTSVPVRPLNPLADSVFTGAMSNVFAYTTTGYAAQSTVAVGPGYWVRYPSGGGQPISGYPVSADTFEVNAGWNMIGSITDPVPVSQVTSVPGGMIASNFFEYKGSYQASDTIRPGGAYWVKTGQAGSLVLSPSGASIPANSIRIVGTSELPPRPPGGAPSLPSHAGIGTSPYIAAPARIGTGGAGYTAVIKYWLPSDGPVSVEILDRSGRRVAGLVDTEMNGGFHATPWSAAGVPEGTYLCRLRAGGRVAVRSIRVER